MTRNRFTPARPAGRRKADTRPVKIDGLSTAEFMLREMPRARASVDARHREGYQITIGAGIWRDIEVSVEPPTCTHPLRSFQTFSEAMAFAADLSRVEGWPIVDKTGEPA